MGTVAWVPAIQDQGSAEDCWTFASATVINSNLLKNGFLSTSSTAPTIQISSWHLSTRNGAPDQLLAVDALGNSSNWGASSMGQALGYLTRGQGQWTIPNVPIDSHTGLPDTTKYISQMGGGIVLDSASVSPSNAFPVSISQDSGQWPANLGSLIPPADQTPAYRLTQAIMLDQGFGSNVALPSASGNVTLSGYTYNTYSFTQGAADPQVVVVKQALVSNGAVTTWMNSESGFQFIANPPGSAVQETVNYVNPQTAVGFSDHSVTIIGWNDSQTITKDSVTYTGAWLVQNSWGTSGWNGGTSTNDGTFWAPYNDAVIGRSGVASFTAAPQAGISVMQNELGPMDYSGNFSASTGNNQSGADDPLLMADSLSGQVASILTPSQDGFLTGVGLTTHLSDINVTLSLYSSWNGAPTGLLSSQQFLLDDGIGYYEFALATQIALTAAADIVFQLQYTDANGNLRGDAIPVTVGGSGINGYLDVTDGLSFYYDQSSGSWTDFSTVNYTASSGADALGGILFVKGLTIVPEPSTLAILLFAGGVFLVIRRRKLTAQFLK